MNEQLRCPIVGDSAVLLAGDNSIDFLGYGDENDFANKSKRKMRFTPGATKGYFSFSVSSAFPSGITSYGTALWSPVIEGSFPTLLHSCLNREHAKKIYNPNKEDKNIGSVLAVDFPSPDNHMGWRVGGSTPKITGVVCYDKLSTAIQDFVGEHSTGRATFTVSMEVFWKLKDSGFAVQSGDKNLFKHTTPDHFSANGWSYVPYSAAPKDLQALWKGDSVKGLWKGKKAAVLMGGLDGSVHYAGLGLVRYGAEPTARIDRLTASADSPVVRLAKLASRLHAS